jgi:hypothetical protein
MIRFLGWVVRPIVEEATRQAHLRRRKEAFHEGLRGLDKFYFMAFGSGSRDAESDRQDAVLDQELATQEEARA